MAEFLIKCKDCGRGVEDPVDHVCPGPPDDDQDDSRLEYNRYAPSSNNIKSKSHVAKKESVESARLPSTLQRNRDTIIEDYAQPGGKSRYNDNHASQDTRASRSRHNDYDSRSSNRDLRTQDLDSTRYKSSSTLPTKDTLPRSRTPSSPSVPLVDLPGAQEDQTSKKFGLDFLTNYTNKLFGGGNADSLSRSKDIGGDNDMSDYNTHDYTNDSYDDRDLNHDNTRKHSRSKSYEKEINGRDHKSRGTSRSPQHLYSDGRSPEGNTYRGEQQARIKKHSAYTDDSYGSPEDLHDGLEKVSLSGTQERQSRLDEGENLLPAQIYKGTSSALCTGCRGLIWKGEEIVRMNEKSMHSSCCMCEVCGTTVDSDRYKGDRWKLRGNKVYCVTCLQKEQQRQTRQSPRTPDSRLKNQSSSRDYGGNDSNLGTSGVCGTCRLPLSANLSQRVIHPKLHEPHHAACLTCQTCNKKISSSFSPSNPVHVRNNKPLCHLCYLISLPRCAGCTNIITRDTRVCVALGKKYHPKCFCCYKCRVDFPDKNFYVLNDQPYCRWCYHEENGSICGGCRQPIEGPCACVVEGRFHPRCFVCTTCKTPLTDVYYAYESYSYCETHILELQRKRKFKAERRQTFFKNM